jgi:transposase
VSALKKAAGRWEGGKHPAVLGRGDGADDEVTRCVVEGHGWDAAEIIGVTERTMRRWRERLQEGAYARLADRRKGKPSEKRVPLATVEQVLGLYQKTYCDLNVTQFYEKLKEEHGIHLCYTWVQQALQGRHQRNLLCAVGGGKIHANGDGWTAGSD